MQAVEVITRKRDGGELTAEEIRWFIQGCVSGEVADYQAAAWLMAVYLQGMSQGETVELTRAMAESGNILDLGDLASRAVDKHSTGGVGDKISLVVVPVAAAAGVIVPKMSGRGLGMSGGTLDKLESIPGFRVDLSDAEILEQIRRIGLVITGQTPSLAPADGKLYALRDVTATVDSLPLIVSSILSKKIAGGAPAIVLDVKAGRGAFMTNEGEAEQLARALVDIGTRCDRRVIARVSNMDQPLGQAVGNALEIREAVEMLHGNGAADLREVVLSLAGEMILAAGLAVDLPEAQAKARQMLESGAAFQKFRAMIAAQGGDVTVVDDLSRLPTAPIQEIVTAPMDGYVASLDAGTVGRALVALGAGRRKKGDTIDHRVGVVFHRKIGASVHVGEALFTLHLADRQQEADARYEILGAYRFSEQPPLVPPILGRRITAGA